jgi:hypothetical protein
MQQISGGWETIVAAGTAAGKFRVFDFTADVSRVYTFWSGLLAESP